MGTDERDASDSVVEPLAAIRQCLSPQVRPWVIGAARVGHIGVGLAYMLLGAVAFGASQESGVKAVGFQGALHRGFENRAGTVLLLVIGFGLLTDGIWQGIRASLDTEPPGPRWKRYLIRASWVATGLGHIGLAVAAIKLVFGLNDRGRQGQLRFWTERILALELGEWFLIGAGLVVIVVGTLLICRALVGRIDPSLDLSSANRPVRFLAMMLARVGMTARGGVIVVGGALLITASVHVNPHEVRGLGGTLRVIQSQLYGNLLLACVATGLIAYGLFELTRARFRRISLP
ncbi:MAG TPA: DUF1206 domain-containing protein [Candidatus Binatia bacterium]|jgi:hypothetical protein